MAVFADCQPNRKLRLPDVYSFISCKCRQPYTIELFASVRLHSKVWNLALDLVERSNMKVDDEMTSSQLSKEFHRLTPSPTQKKHPASRDGGRNEESRSDLIELLEGDVIIVEVVGDVKVSGDVELRYNSRLPVNLRQFLLEPSSKYMITPPLRATLNILKKSSDESHFVCSYKFGVEAEAIEAFHRKLEVEMEQEPEAVMPNPPPSLMTSPQTRRARKPKAIVAKRPSVVTFQHPIKQS